MGLTSKMGTVIVTISEHHQFSGAIHGKGEGKHRLKHAENGSVCPNSQCQGKYGDGGEAGGLSQHAESKAEVLRQSFEELRSPSFATFLPDLNGSAKFEVGLSLRAVPQVDPARDLKKVDNAHMRSPIASTEEDSSSLVEVQRDGFCGLNFRRCGSFWRNRGISQFSRWWLRKPREVWYIALTPGKAMSLPPKANGTRKFADFVVDPRAGELFRRGKKIKLQHQPTQVLLALLDKPGQIVTREELRQKIWSEDTFVDFEHSLNTAIKKLRLALGDRATNSKFVETLPRRGYRFLARVEADEENLVIRTAPSALEGKVFKLAGEGSTECVLAPVDERSLEEWKRLLGLNDDVGVSMMITEKRLLLLEAGMDVRLLAVAGGTGWCEVRILEGEHYGRTALLNRKSLKATDRSKTDC
jgi:DNA-binding winged helix-turn-helix (wHTH) protein